MDCEYGVVREEGVPRLLAACPTRGKSSQQLRLALIKEEPKTGFLLKVSSVQEQFSEKDLCQQQEKKSTLSEKAGIFKIILSISPKKQKKNLLQKKIALPSTQEKHLEINTS